MKFFITGFTGAGKTSLLNELKTSKELKSFQFFDLDLEILKELEGESIADFIETAGFSKFRDLELNHLSRLTNYKNIVVSLGGGAFNEMTAGILDTWTGLWINTPLEECLKRITGDNSRPIVRKSKEELKAIYNQILSFYQLANPVQTKDEALELILKKSENIT